MGVYKVAVKGAQTKEGFIRDSLIQLYSACDAPETIDSVELKQVNESNYQFLGCSGEFDVEYTAEIGYDRSEQYLDTVREYDSTLKKHVNRTVVKERTVTDWRPHSGKVHKETVSLIQLENNDTVDYGDLDPDVASCYGYYYYNDQEVVSSGILKTDEEALAQYDFAEPAEHHLLEALDGAQSRANIEVKCELPGDKNRNFRPDTKNTNAEFFVYAVKRFKTAFEFNGKTHYLKQFTTEAEPTIYCSAMNSDEEANMLQKAEENELKSDPIIQKNKKYASYARYGFIGSIVFAILIGIVVAGLIGFENLILFILGVIGAIAARVIGYIFESNVSSRTNEIKARFGNKKNDHFSKLQEKKISLLNARLTMMGQEPLSDSELEYFSEEKKHQLDANYKS